MKMLNLDKNIEIRNSRSALAHNFKLIKKQLVAPCLLSVAVKANAYGHGLVETSQELAKLGVDWLCVTSAAEGIKLRQAGLKLPILIIGPISNSDLNQILKFNLKTFIYDLGLAKTLNTLAQKLNKTATVHLKLDTGMSRQGINISDLEQFVKAVSRLTALNLEGIATHFATADEAKDNPEFLKQLKTFNQATTLAEKLLNRKLVKHCANSAATLLYPRTHCDLVRVGISAYGYYPSSEVRRNLTKRQHQLQPVMSVITEITHLKTIAPGTGVSYGLTFKAERPLKLALLPLGYFDGLNRLLSNQGRVLIKGQRAPIIGRICMDITLVDVTKIKNVKVGDVATIIGVDKNQQITADDLAQQTGTINYEALTNWKEEIIRNYN